MVEPPLEHGLLAHQIVDAAFAVRTALGPGLLASVCEQCLVYELETLGISFQRQVALPVRYRDKRIDTGYRLDPSAAWSSWKPSHPKNAAGA